MSSAMTSKIAIIQTDKPCTKIQPANCLRNRLSLEAITSGSARLRSAGTVWLITI
jgi:hypothetical protein